MKLNVRHGNQLPENKNVFTFSFFYSRFFNPLISCKINKKLFTKIETFVKNDKHNLLE